MLSAPEIPARFAPHSKVWIYQSDRPFTVEEEQTLIPMLDAFARKWTAHNVQLDALAMLYASRVIILLVDETKAGASGCSIDTSVHFIQSIEQKFGVQLFNRNIINYFLEDTLYTTELQALNALLADQKINEHTLLLDPLVSTRAQLDAQFIVPLHASWIYGIL